jgi:hypothetical protein
MRTTDALGIGGNCQKGKDRGDAYNLEKGLRERQRKNRRKLRPAIWSRQKEHAPNQISDVMDRRGQGGSELRVQKKRMILQRREFANYLRENSGVKAYRISSKHRCGCAEARYYNLGGNEFTPDGGLKTSTLMLFPVQACTFGTAGQV